MEASNQPRNGYKKEIFLDQKAASNLACCICKNVLKNAIQIYDQRDPKRACYDCYIHERQNRNGVCPIFETYNVDYYPDKFADRQVEELPVDCINKGHGCAWRDRLRYNQEHVNKCDYRLILCNQCNKWVVLFDHRRQHYDPSQDSSQINSSNFHEESQNAMGQEQSHLVLPKNCEEKTLIEELMAENHRLTAENRQVTRENYWLQVENTQMKEEIEEYKRRI